MHGIYFHATPSEVTNTLSHILHPYSLATLHSFPCFPLEPSIVFLHTQHLQPEYTTHTFAFHIKDHTFISNHRDVLG
jgi:hypothetical protein